MPIEVLNRRRSLESLAAQRPDALILDVTSRGPEPWVRFSPFYPHGDIPVPGWPGHVSESVEGLWQALKVFDTADVDLDKLAVTSMSGLKRTVRRYGPVRGHRIGDDLLAYRDARYRIYLPAYRWVLDNKVADLVAELRKRATDGAVVLLDYTVNGDPDDLRRPLSHAALLARHLEDRWPE